MLPRKDWDGHRRDDEVIDNIIREIFGPDVNLEYIDKDAVSNTVLPLLPVSLLVLAMGTN